VATEIGDKKIVGDGTAQVVELNDDKTKYMSAAKAAEKIIKAAQKKKKKYHLTSAGSLGTTMHGLFPGFINSAVRKEMKSIIKEQPKEKGSAKETQAKSPRSLTSGTGSTKGVTDTKDEASSGSPKVNKQKEKAQQDSSAAPSSDNDTTTPKEKGKKKAQQSHKETPTKEKEKERE